MLYKEDRTFGNSYRLAQKEEMTKYLDLQKIKSNEKRKDYFKPDLSSVDKYLSCIDAYRADFYKLLGDPLPRLNEYKDIPACNETFVAKDSLSYIYRMIINVGEGLSVYGIFFKPLGNGEKNEKFPFVISQHGGIGTPELCSDFFGSSNYNDMTRRALRLGYAVFAPQLLLWSEEFGPSNERQAFDIGLKQCGSSITAVEIFKLMRSIDYFSSRSDIDENRIGMIGLSYGGFYTLFAAASDKRIKVAVSSAFFNNRLKYNWKDWTWFSSANMFLDAETAALVCPRYLCIEVGVKDELFDINEVYPEFNRAKSYYEALGLSDNIILNVHNGTHEFDKGDTGMEFLKKYL